MWVGFLFSVEGATSLLPEVMIFLLCCTYIPTRAILRHLQTGSPQIPRETDLLKMMAQSVSVLLSQYIYQEREHLFNSLG